MERFVSNTTIFISRGENFILDVNQRDFIVRKTRIGDNREEIRDASHRLTLHLTKLSTRGYIRAMTTSMMRQKRTFVFIFFRGAHRRLCVLDCVHFDNATHA